MPHNHLKADAPRGEEITRAMKLGHARGFLGVEPEPHPRLGFPPGGILHTVYRDAWQLGRQVGAS
jgi:hypothetical protein